MDFPGRRVNLGDDDNGDDHVDEYLDASHDEVDANGDSGEREENDNMKQKTFVCLEYSRHVSRIMMMLMTMIKKDMIKMKMRMRMML